MVLLQKRTKTKLPALAKQNHLVSRLLQGARKRKVKENRKLTCIQTESTEIEETVDKDKSVS